MVLLWLLMLTTLPRPATSCSLDDEAQRCSCNFSGPDPAWNQAIVCLSALEVELRAGGRDLGPFLEKGLRDPEPLAETMRALRIRRLTLGEVTVPGALLGALLHVLGYTRLKELELEEVAVTGPLPPPAPGVDGPRLTALRLRNVSWEAAGPGRGRGGDGPAGLWPWLDTGLRELKVTGSGLERLPCPAAGAFPALRSLDLSHNPALGAAGAAAALCPGAFPGLRVLGLRDTGLSTLGPLCTALDGARGALESLDLSHNALASTGACAWPPSLRILNLAHNRLTKEPDLRALPALEKVELEGNPFSSTMEKLKDEPIADAPESPLASHLLGMLACAAAWTLLAVAGN
ncbi:monocyte differentiation antigen CD14 [Tachyglossus aculeatus]|uniref:monocyte differentiation antigen CD14 n=1 Tax=Tachyglossus aculeatus TaxID=9261 RepID=UPI0018F613BB|nr:monocyte differentiation antigen CD14 [Tachyglossus aculeatus]